MSEFWSKYTLDEYDRRSRLQPALVVALPIVFATLVWFPENVISWGTLVSLLTYGGGVALVVQIARDRGKDKEEWLFDRWGGKPTTRLLRHRDAPNQTVLERRHNKLGDIIPDVELPTEEQENKDLERADEIYDLCVTVLRERTRDNKLVFEENCNYGFRRNLWGMRPEGVIISTMGIIIVGYKIYIMYSAGGSVTSLITIMGGINLILLVLWVFWITPEWVKTAADAYAEQLLSAGIDSV